MTAGPSGPEGPSARSDPGEPSGGKGPSARDRGRRDPRTIVTPEAFTIAPELLGLPLASPSRRLVAMLVDLVVIGTIYLVTRSAFFILFLLVAALLLRASYRGIRESDFMGRAFRFSVGCLGAVILIVTILVVAFFRLPPPPAGPGEEVTAESVREPGLRELLRGSRAALLFRRAPTEEAAIRAGAAVVREARRFGVGAGEAEEILRETMSPAAPWREDADRVIAEALAAGGLGEPAEPDTTGPASEPAAGAALTLAEAWSVWSRWREEAGTDEAPPPEVEAARARLLEEVASDTAAALSELLDEERERRALAERRGPGGLFGWIRNVVEELGFGFGWAALYFTLVTPWTGGRTLGKRLLGIRIVQLDGSPINWWEAFERAGGYAAGFATGLLGFAQVYWDPNRQAIHDKVAGTVVVRDGLPPVPGPWRRGVEAYAAARRRDAPPPSAPTPDPVDPPGPSTS